MRWSPSRIHASMHGLHLLLVLIRIIVIVVIIGRRCRGCLLLLSGVGLLFLLLFHLTALAALAALAALGPHHKLRHLPTSHAPHSFVALSLCPCVFFSTGCQQLGERGVLGLSPRLAHGSRLHWRNVHVVVVALQPRAAPLLALLCPLTTVNPLLLAPLATPSFLSISIITNIIILVVFIVVVIFVTAVCDTKQVLHQGSFLLLIVTAVPLLAAVACICALQQLVEVLPPLVHCATQRLAAPLPSLVLLCSRVNLKLGLCEHGLEPGVDEVLQRERLAHGLVLCILLVLRRDGCV